MEGKRSVNLTGAWDTRISRRVLLRTGGSAAAGLFMLGRAASSAAAPPWDQVNPFSLGVASGDPTPDGFVLWTRLLPEGTPLDGSVMKQEPYGVRYEVAADPEFRTIVRRGSEEAVWEESHTVHAEIARPALGPLVLVPLQVGPGDQPGGRTRTAPAARRGGRRAPLRVRVLPELRAAATTAPTPTSPQEDVDLVVHLGDYIYEDVSRIEPGPGAPAQLPASECRLALATTASATRSTRRDPDLQAAHRSLPVARRPGTTTRSRTTTPASTSTRTSRSRTSKLRRAAAYLAYWEHQPLSRRASRWTRTCRSSAARLGRAGDVPRDRHAPIPRRPVGRERLRRRRDRRSGYCPSSSTRPAGCSGDEQRDLALRRPRRAEASGWNVLANQVGFAPQDSSPDATGAGASARQLGRLRQRAPALLDHSRPRSCATSSSSPATSTSTPSATCRPLRRHRRRAGRDRVHRHVDLAAADERTSGARVPCDGVNNPHILWGDRAAATCASTPTRDAGGRLPRHRHVEPRTSAEDGRSGGDRRARTSCCRRPASGHHCSLARCLRAAPVLAAVLLTAAAAPAGAAPLKARGSIEQAYVTGAAKGQRVTLLERARQGRRAREGGPLRQPHLPQPEAGGRLPRRSGREEHAALRASCEAGDNPARALLPPQDAPRRPELRQGPRRDRARDDRPAPERQDRRRRAVPDADRVLGLPGRRAARPALDHREPRSPTRSRPRARPPSAR